MNQSEGGGVPARTLLLLLLLLWLSESAAASPQTQSEIKTFDVFSLNSNWFLISWPTRAAAEIILSQSADTFPHYWISQHVTSNWSHLHLVFVWTTQIWRRITIQVHWRENRITVCRQPTLSLMFHKFHWRTVPLYQRWFSPSWLLYSPAFR